MKWTSFAVILMVGSLTLATASDAQARGGGGSRGGGGGGRGGFGGGGGGGGILGGILGGLMGGSNNQSLGRTPQFRRSAPSQSGGGWNTWQNNGGNNSTNGWNNWFQGGGNNGYTRPSYNYTRPSYNYTQPNYTQPRTVARPAPAPAPPAPPAVTRAAPPPNVLPVAKKKITPKANAISLKGRSITAAEIQRGGSYFDGELQKMVSDIATELGDSAVDQVQLVVELTDKDVPSQTQLQILQAVEKGEAAQTQILWASAVKDAASAADLSRKVAVERVVKDLRKRVDTSSLTMSDLHEARGDLAKLNLDGAKLRAVTSVLDVMETTLKIQNAVTGAIPGTGLDSVVLPTGSVPIVMNPKLPAGQALSLGNGYVMIGTGGEGALELTNGSVPQMMGLPIAPGNPAREDSGEIILDGVVLVNPSDTGTTVHYKLKDKDYQMEPGYSQALPGDSWLVDFHRGGPYGRKKYGLSSGAYTFTPTDKGWELYSKTHKVTVDNSDNPNEFHYTVQNEHATVGARQTKSHESKYPIVIRFDRGNGTATKQVKAQDGTLKVAINPSVGLWDLYSPESTAGSGASGGFVPAF